MTPRAAFRPTLLEYMVAAPHEGTGPFAAARPPARHRLKPRWICKNASPRVAWRVEAGTFPRVRGRDAAAERDDSNLPGDFLCSIFVLDNRRTQSMSDWVEAASPAPCDRLRARAARRHIQDGNPVARAARLTGLRVAASIETRGAALAARSKSANGGLMSLKANETVRGPLLQEVGINFGLAPRRPGTGAVPRWGRGSPRAAPVPRHARFPETHRFRAAGEARTADAVARETRATA